MKEPLTGPCEAGIDVEQNSGQPRIVKCHRPGRLIEGGLFGFMLCDLHEHLVEEWRKRYLTMLEDLKRRKKK